MTETGFEAIIVAPAYRLNIFGFVAGKELQDEAAKAGEAAGNLGFWDQRTALEWTARNIGHFGGNAANITVAGMQSSNGLNKVCFALLTAVFQHRLLCRLSQHFPPTGS